MGLGRRVLGGGGGALWAMPGGRFGGGGSVCVWWGGVGRALGCSAGAPASVTPPAAFLSIKGRQNDRFTCLPSPTAHPPTLLRPTHPAGAHPGGGARRPGPRLTTAESLASRTKDRASWPCVGCVCVHSKHGSCARPEPGRGRKPSPFESTCSRS